MKPLKSSILSLILFLTYTACYGQAVEYKGTIVLFDSIPVMNAEIFINSTKNTIKSDSSGNFSFEGTAKEKIKINASGFLSQKVNLKTSSQPVKINLKLKGSEKSQQLAVKSGHIKDADQFFTLVLYYKNNPDYSRYTDAIQIIKDQNPGVTIQNNGVVIRGKKSLHGSSNALIEVDGVVVDFNALTSIPTATIKSIKILTTSMSGMYGSRGANGVVVITTKK